jgi:GLPGLI family protein
MLLVNRFGAIINEEITRDFSSSRLTINAVMGPGSYEIEVPIPQIDWAITDEKKKISGYTCQKAKANVAGRMYEAWFAPDLPYQHGPWKLAGLPGLIMEARDSTNEIVFLFKELKNNSATEKKVTSFLNKPYSVKTSYKEYVRVRTAFEKDPESVMAAIAPNTKVTVYNVDGGANTSSLRIKKFNPIELD